MANKKQLFLLTICVVFFSNVYFANTYARQQSLLADYQFTESDAVLVTNGQGEQLYAWQIDRTLIPASLAKLVSTWLAVEKWGLQHRFSTLFYRLQNQLWVKGFGDPYLTSEELDVVAKGLIDAADSQGWDIKKITAIHLDDSHFAQALVPGRSKVADPYNAPLSAIAANFNTVKLRRKNGQLISAESQTPLTVTAKKLAKNIAIGSKALRVNLLNTSNAQLHFAQILQHKLSLKNLPIKSGELPSEARLLYQHLNSHALDSVLQGAMHYSNNFIANQLFLKLAESAQLSQPLGFAQAQAYVKHKIDKQFAWQGVTIEEGAGLSRNNRLSAKQINQLLNKLKAHKTLFKKIEFAAFPKAQVYAKTGTLNGVSNYAGYIDLNGQQYQFVILLSSKRPYGYRNKILQSLLLQLSH